MTDLVAAIGLVFALEGSLYALFPGALKKLATRAIELPADRLRIGGLASVVLGVVLVWVVRR